MASCAKWLFLKDAHENRGSVKSFEALHLFLFIVVYDRD